MVAYSFRDRFVGPILAGTKRQTIRSPRRGRARHAIVNGPVTLLNGPRFSPRVLGRSVCNVRTKVVLRFGILAESQIRVSLSDLSYVKSSDATEFFTVTYPDPDAFAVADGFESWDDLAAFWAETHGDEASFEGELIRWLPL